MPSHTRIAVVILALGVIAGLTALLLVRRPAVPHDSALEKSIASFMKCLPEDTTDAQREEIDGIMTRFYIKAVTGQVYPRDVLAITDDIDTYVERGRITHQELIEFMKKVGTATRRMEEEGRPPGVGQP
ncbi:MAG: hypothetical protein P8181_01505 [bacterium]